MALIKCPECGGQISDRAKKCPHCGCTFPIHKPSTISPNIIDIEKNEPEIKEFPQFSRAFLPHEQSSVEVNEFKANEIEKPAIEKDKSVNEPTKTKKDRIWEIALWSAIVVVLLIGFLLRISAPKSEIQPEDITLESIDEIEDTEDIDETAPNDAQPENNEIKVGDYISFGKYEQDNNISNGKEVIDWLVLAKEDDKILVISEKGLDCRHYNNYRENTTWEKSFIRKWLNSEFLSTAFSMDEQEKIIAVDVPADRNPKYGTSAGNSTVDKVFLLSIAEAEQFFSSDETRKCVPTAYAGTQAGWNVSTLDSKVCCFWMLRTPGDYSGNAAEVTDGGLIDYMGGNVQAAYYCLIRPALWVSLELFG